MKKLLLSGITAVALMAAGTAQAGGLNLSGATGLARTPVAATSAPMSLTLAADYVASEDTFVPMRLNFGVIEGLEIGALYYFFDTEGDPKTWGVNAKYVIPVQLVENLGIAVGAGYDSTSSDAPDDVTEMSAYAVATYAIEAGVTIKPSFGIAYEKIEAGDFDESGMRFFASVLAMVMPELAVGAEYVSTQDDLDGEDADASIWVGARYMTPVPGLAVQAGMINNANIGGGENAEDFVFHVGAQYGFNFAQ
jgi:hypothetical protein